MTNYQRAQRAARIGRWVGYALLAAAWVGFVIMWAIEGGNPYP